MVEERRKIERKREGGIEVKSKGLTFHIPNNSLFYQMYQIC